MIEVRCIMIVNPRDYIDSCSWLFQLEGIPDIFTVVW